MPHLTTRISATGPLLDLEIGVSEIRAKALAKSGKPIPKPVQIQGLIDTGASISAVDKEALNKLELDPTGTVGGLTPSSSGKHHKFRQFDVSLKLIHTSFTKKIDPLAVVECELEAQGIQALIGRDILSECLLVYDGVDDTFALAF